MVLKIENAMDCGIWASFQLIILLGYVVYYCPTDVVTQRLEQTVLVFLRRYMENPKVAFIFFSCILRTLSGIRYHTFI